MDNSSTKITSPCVGISRFKSTSASKTRYYHNTSASQGERIIKNDTSVIIKESRYINGWKDNAKILSKSEFIDRLKNRK